MHQEQDMTSASNHDTPHTPAQDKSPQDTPAHDPSHHATSHHVCDDRALQSLLDAALAPGAVPQGLQSRIFLQTQPILAANLAANPAQNLAASGTLERTLTLRLGRIWFRRVHAVAAGIVLAASAAVLLVASGIYRDARDTVTAKQDIQQLGSYPGFETPIDQEILQLAMRIDDVAAYRQTDADAMRTIHALDSLMHQAPANGAGDTAHQLF